MGFRIWGSESILWFYSCSTLEIVECCALVGSLEANDFPLGLVLYLISLYIIRIARGNLDLMIMLLCFILCMHPDICIMWFCSLIYVCNFQMLPLWCIVHWYSHVCARCWYFGYLNVWSCYSNPNIACLRVWMCMLDALDLTPRLNCTCKNLGKIIVRGKQVEPKLPSSNSFPSKIHS